MAENRDDFGIKLVMINPLKNYYFWWIDRSVCCILNSFWTSLIQVLWTKLWLFC